jgi:5'(3')-deoxyribonucleotidase
VDSGDQFVVGLDLDGVCCDFYGKMREVAAEWLGVPLKDLTTNVTYGLSEWGLSPREYERIHRFAVTQRDLFRVVDPIPGAAQSLRRLTAEGLRIRVVTHRLFISHFHEIAVGQTVQWLESHAIPYSDLCFMRDKSLVDAHIYVEDTDQQVRALQDAGKKVVAFTNSTNINMLPPPLIRATTWQEAETVIRQHYYEWRRHRGLALPKAPGYEPPETPAATLGFDPCD